MKFPIRYRVYLPLIALLCTAACVLRTVACLTVRDAHGYFPGSALPEISFWLLLVGALFALSYPIFNKPTAVRPRILVQPIGIFPTGLLAATQLVFAVQLLMTLSERDGYSAISGAAVTLRICLILVGILGMLSVAYYALCMLIDRDENELRCWFGMAAVLFCALYAVYLYFDTAVPLNSTCKVTSQIAYLSMALFLLLDVRTSLGRPSYARQIAVGFITAPLCAYASLPSMITLLARGEVIDHTVYETVFTFVFFLFVCARLFALARLPEDAPTPLVVQMDTLTAPPTAPDANDAPTAEDRRTDAEGIAKQDVPAPTDDTEIATNDTAEARQDGGEDV